MDQLAHHDQQATLSCPAVAERRILVEPPLAATARTSHRKQWLALALALVLVASACGGGGAHASQGAKQQHPAATPTTAPTATAAVYTCTYTQQSPTVQGTPDIASVPSIQSVSLVPRAGGLLISYKFRKPVAAAPEGVYFAWTVYVYRHRSDAAHPDQALTLQIEDRGKGWEPTGWTILASTGQNQSPVRGSIHTDKARDELQTLFPAGFADLSPPFYWFTSQVEYRAYLPKPSKVAPQDFSVNGTIDSNCPAGVTQGPYTVPNSARLLTATG